ncbi:MAG: class I SAM-dependent methyltransferase [Pseudomonadota bacterium]
MTPAPNAHAAPEAARHMDGLYRYQRHIYDASRKYYLLGRDRLIAELRPPPGGRLLEVGCGTARNLILAARRYREVAAYGFDISPVMLETARRNIARAGLSRRIVVTEGDAARWSAEPLLGVAGFDRILISYALSMISPWREALEAAYRGLVPGGELHVVDFGQQERLPRWFRSGLHAWLALFSVTPRADLLTELAALARRHGAGLDHERLYRGYAVRAVVRKPVA